MKKIKKMKRKTIQKTNQIITMIKIKKMKETLKHDYNNQL